MTNNDNILFINRDKILLEDLGKAFREKGYSIHTAFDMRGALSALSANSMGLIICDNTLQDVTGYEFLRFLKNDPLREKIPFIFLVPINDQGRPINAFKLGASDFIVYPITTEDLICRIKEVVFQPKSGDYVKPQQSPADSTTLTPMANNAREVGSEKRRSKRIYPLSTIRVDISRNGVLWLPAQIKNINRDGIFLETSLLGKAGLEIYIKVALPSGTSIIKGQVKHIAFKNYNPSAGIGVEVEKSAQWREILQYVITVVKKAEAPSPNSSPSASSLPQNPQTTLVSSGENRNAVRSTSPSMERVKVSASYELRFYQSLVGKQLDNYKAVSFIGSGAMGGVFEGWDIALERKVALKVISYRLASKERWREMFIKEARFVSKLDHPNIAHMYHIGNVNEILYFAMEYIDGVTMADMIKRGDKFNTLKGLNYLITICEALDFVHQNNIIHRDIKPANIMINEKGIVKIVDFGVAKIVAANGDDNKKEEIVGSPYYICPEAIEGRPLDLRSDIYSLGASFYHGFTGSPPFEGNNTEEVLNKHIKQSLIPLRKKNPKVSSALGRVIEKMMAKTPENRYQDYKGIIKDLKGLESRAQKFQKLKNATLIFRIKPREHVPS
jgi:DNA-binding response OmpR family regulator/tRNA A-37 threonylcarbamoyl transferase component Bud32